MLDHFKFINMIIIGNKYNNQSVTISFCILYGSPHIQAGGGSLYSKPVCFIRVFCLS